MSDDEDGDFLYKACTHINLLHVLVSAMIYNNEIFDITQLKNGLKRELLELFLIKLEL